MECPPHRASLQSRKKRRSASVPALIVAEARALALIAAAEAIGQAGEGHAGGLAPAKAHGLKSVGRGPRWNRRRATEISRYFETW